MLSAEALRSAVEGDVKSMISSFKEDYFRHYGSFTVRLINLLKDRALQCSYAIRKNGLIGRLLRQRIEHRYGVNFGLVHVARIGGGLYLGHPFCIDVNAEAVIGSNCNIGKCVTIGRENRGEREGSPTLGNMVWVGSGAVIVGRITIGDDVLIAPNSYVNMDVPAHSIVVGNPARIIPRDNATAGYVNNIV